VENLGCLFKQKSNRQGEKASIAGTIPPPLLYAVDIAEAPPVVQVDKQPSRKEISIPLTLFPLLDFEILRHNEGITYSLKETPPDLPPMEASSESLRDFTSLTAAEDPIN
jgi:hypothetical protein